MLICGVIGYYQHGKSSESQAFLHISLLGILSGTSALLLIFDDAEVRKILTQCRSVMEYVQVCEVIEVLPDAVTFLKNLSPGIFTMAKSVDNRIKDLTHATHRELLQKHMKACKVKAPMLINAIKTFVATIHGMNFYREFPDFL